MGEIHNEPIRRILVVRKGAIGDVLLASAILPALERKHPGSQIDFETSCPEALQNNAYIHRLVATGCSNREAYEQIIDLDWTYEKAPDRSIVEAYAEAAAVDRAAMSLSYRPSDADIAAAKQILQSSGIDRSTLIAVQSGSSYWLKAMDPKYMGKIFAELKKKLSVTFVLLGSKQDPHIRGTEDLRGIGSIQQSAGILRQCIGYIGHDSALIHFAKAMHVPIAAFFGNTDPLLRVAPDEKDLLFRSPLGCQGCYHQRRPPVVISFCGRQSFFWRFVDEVLQIGYGHSSNISRHRYMRALRDRVYSYQNRRRNGERTALCMKAIEDDSVEQQLLEWIRSLLTRRNGS
jgi:ADP-heptose:LPS heptosyltransferase